ncbi:class I adenylate-forming enzyme family protein [Conexibacter sp. CPCC 206217]|uniref:class I adenylate-forming enzyme family protein n=1 Tax=Conexibacter sp. CPCC 206217 TaxID=3064574 RepID=UPI002722337B|nr:class I adenylate-forming enzyme family protein [Conexibacter sp. CPCC 206217]MDO8209547.1 class I adenylate-forming enzyme family protein [Conexibacter sp. CPCC 206217]
MLIEGRPLPPPSVAPHDLLRAGLAAGPDRLAAISAVRHLTWRALDDESSALAARYRQLGLAPGDRLASLMPNRIDLLVHYLACFKARVVATPLNYRYTAREIDHALEVSGAGALLVHAERAEDLAASRLAATLPQGTIAYGGELPGARHGFEALLDAPPLALDGAPPAPDDAAVIFFTSGSTGPAKGVTHTHETLRWMFASCAAGLELSADDVALPASSMSHVGSFLWSFAALSVGAQVIVARSYDAYEVLPLLRAHRPTFMAMVPAALAAFVRDHDVSAGDLASLRLCRTGSDMVSAELLSEFAQLAGIPLDEGYGMTEVGLATVNPPSGVIKQGSIGRPIDGFCISIRDDSDGLLGTGAVGRVWIRTRSRMAGYWEDPAATAEVLRDGWIDSGDLAHADDDGYLWFFGRKKQIIVHDGSNISPREVEGALMEHPAVALVGVVGIHDVVHGENVRAYVTLRPQTARPAADELILFCRERVGYKAPEEVVFLGEMPLNPTGKIDRVGLKRMAEEHVHEAGAGAR